MRTRRTRWRGVTSTSTRRRSGIAPRLVSDMAGRTSPRVEGEGTGIDLDEKGPEMKALIDELKEREYRGYEYEAADASFRLLAAKHLGTGEAFFPGRELPRDHRAARRAALSEATVKLKVDGEWRHTVAEEAGPVGALDKALRLAWRKVIRACAR